ncbi:hypothetical protein KKG45_05820 [bacterium]|nr:hypothetical protein [bacterium]MBU1072745.1 hypothetical protein [bacterium]MBU1677067.1 hypothetical protein [bacterium]
MSGIWWGGFEFAAGEMRAWRLGPLEVWITRAAAEFRVATRSDPGGDEFALRAGEPCTEPVPDDAELVRYGVRDASRRLEIAPAAADRAVIVKSETTFIVPPGGATTAFISSPIWLRIQLPEPRRLLHEEPAQRPSDTWFGASTLEGELCYAIRTSVRFDLKNLPVRPYRAVSVVRILNHADTPLPLARLRLPLPYLSFYADGDGRLWTESVTLDRRQDDDLAEIKLGKSAPREAGQCTKVTGPREEMEKKHLIRSFTGLLGLRKDREGYERVVE